MYLFLKATADSCKDGILYDDEATLLSAGICSLLCLQLNNRCSVRLKNNTSL